MTCATIVEPIGLLVRQRPDWVELLPGPFRRVTVEARPIRASGQPTPPYLLEVHSISGEVLVREVVGGRLPARCPERHINDDGTFCIGYEAGKDIETDEAAERWWKKLMVYLLCQDTADRTRTWPDYAALSHGDAGKTQLITEDLALKRGMLEAAQAAVLDEGPIYLALKLISKHERRLINGRAECVCGLKTKSGAPVLRYICNRKPEQCLVLLENRRRREEQEFWNERRNQVCCMSMDGCPLRKYHHAR